MSGSRPEVFHGRNYYPHSADNTNFRITCQGHLFWVHKDVISQESPYFQAVVKGNFTEGQNGRLALRDMQPEVFHAVLAYMYTGKLQSFLVHSPPEFYNYHVGRRLEDEIAEWDKNTDYKGTAMSKAFACVLIYIAADRLCLDDLRYLAADEFEEHFRPRKPSDELPDDFTDLIAQVYDNTRTDDQNLKRHITTHLKKYLSEHSSLAICQRAFKESFMRYEHFAWDIFSDCIGTWSNECDLHRRATGYLSHVLARESGIIDTLHTNTECRHCGHEFGCTIELVGANMRRIEKESWLRCTKCRTRHFPVGFPAGKLY
ncbi:BTB/POZ domain protein [Paecilomyces variotii No. 5]|uniref:BTB/POZ domain protein n=1 Tax=Byssochlamys spectabilis (strain No. 5 / NBRC 109023) TaxID=1356009 RepID=V5I5B0_BYSSN|nr:BTB/POZ domain protein [Paecilomyces variotii No. 5]